MTDVATTHSKELEQYQPSLSVEEFRQRLEQVISLDEIRNASHIVTAGTAYAKAIGSRELTDKAVEMRTWLEQRAGQIAKQEKMSLKALTESLGISSAIARRWRLLGSLNDDQVEWLLSECKSTGELTMGRVQRLIEKRLSKEVKPGIHKLPDGTFQIRWKSRGVHHTRTVRSEKLSAAETALRKERYYDRHDRKYRARPDISRAYGYVRSALSILDKARVDSSPDVRASIDAAITVLHWSEDNISEALRLQKIYDLARQRGEDQAMGKTENGKKRKEWG